MQRIGIIGAGKVGTALGVLLKQKNYSIVGVASRTLEKAQTAAQLIQSPVFTRQEELLEKGNCFFLTTSDGAIENLAQELAASGKVKKGDYFLHFSGALPAEVLWPLKEKGGYVFSLHPLQTFASVETALKNLPGSFFAGQGDGEILPFAEKLVLDLDGELFSITKEAKALYHAGACVACNYLVSLLHWAGRIYQTIGIPQDKALKALLPLVKGTVNNLEDLGPIQALTGPIARGDHETIVQHLKAFERMMPELKDLYAILGLYTVGIGLEKGSLGEELGEKIKNTFNKEIKKND